MENFHLTYNYLSQVNHILPRLRNHNATDNGNVHFRYTSEKFYVRGLDNSCKVVDLLAQKLLNDMTFD